MTSWNWGLGQWQDQYQGSGKPNEMALRRPLNAIKDEQFLWMSEVTKTAPQQAIKNLGTAFKNVFEGRAKFPSFKKKGVHDSFRADNGPFAGDRLGANARAAALCRSSQDGGGVAHRRSAANVSLAVSQDQRIEQSAQG